MYVNLTIKEQLTFVNLAREIHATEVAIKISHKAQAGDFILLVSEIVEPEPFDTGLKSIIGHIPSKNNCYRKLAIKRFQQFFISLEDIQGKPYNPPNGFFIELHFKDVESDN